MPLPAPNLDDRRFQELVDEAKRMVQKRCPEWTDHNVHDPGVTLIEVFASMTDQIVYRLNQVPERNYIKFLDLLGVRLFPPTAARVPVTFWLSAPQDEVVVVPEGVEVATARTETLDAVTFATTDDLSIIPSELARVRSRNAAGEHWDHTRALADEQQFECFSTHPNPDDTFLVGLSAAVPSNAVTLRFECFIDGVGVDPTDPPLVWEAWTGEDWAACELDRDGTGGLARTGEVVLHVPAGHAVSVIEEQRAAWLRARVIEAEEGQPQYTDSPTIRSVAAHTSGGTVMARNARMVRDEIIGFSDGVPGQRFAIEHAPIIPAGQPLVVEVSSEDGWQTWTEVEDFAGSGPDDHHVVIDGTAGEVLFGPAVRSEDGTVRHYGAVPPHGVGVRIPAYLTGGGVRGNVAVGAIDRLRSPRPYIARVENRYAATGGKDGETIENAKARGPLHLRTRNRAVTIEDYAQLAREIAPDADRVHAVAAGDGADAGGVRVMVVPNVVDQAGRVAFGDLVPPDELMGRIAGHLDRCRTIGARVVVEPPSYLGITVVARVRARQGADPAVVQRRCLERLFSYFHPVRGGPDGKGWPFGRPVHVGEVYAGLQSLPDVELIEDARLFPADPITGERGEARDRIELDADALVFSHDHQVRVT